MGLLDINETLQTALHEDGRLADADLMIAGLRTLDQQRLQAGWCPRQADPGGRIQPGGGCVRAADDVEGPVGELQHDAEMICGYSPRYALPMTQEPPGLTMLVDSSSLVYRAFFAVPDTVRAPDGTPVNGAYGFLNMLARLVAEHRPSRLACALDEDWRPEWRVALLDSYKTHRLGAPDADSEDPVERQIEIVTEILELAGVATAGSPRYEAEDAIGTLVKRTRGRIAIVSGDRDLFQLVRDPDVYVLYPVRGVSDLTIVNEAEIRRRYGIPGRAYADYAILRGDPSDGLPGVRGIGEKTSSALITAHGSVERVLAAAKATPAGPLAKVAAAADYIARAARVVRITGEAPLEELDITLPRHAPKPSLERRAEGYALDGAVRRLLAAIKGAAKR